MKTYDPKQVTIICGGFIIEGFAEDSMIELARREDTFSLTIGTDGEGTRSKSNDKSGEITIHLMASSKSNAVLSAFAKSDELTNNGTFAFLLRDNSGDSYWAAAEAFIAKPPDAEYAGEVGSREWKILTDVLDWFEGGN